MKYLLALFLLFPNLGFAGLSEGVEAFNRKEYTNALKEFTALAEKNEAEAMYYLGVMHERGYGVPQSDEKAFSYYTKAAELQEVKSAMKLGQAYQIGVKVPQNTKIAYKWFGEAAKQNNDMAQYIIGSWYLKEQDFTKAIKLFMMSASQGNNDAQFELGNIFFEGNGVPQDYAQAILWYKLSANQGNISAQRKLADLYATETVKGVTVNPAMAHYWYNLIAAYNIGIVREDAIKKRDEMAAKMKSDMITVSQGKASSWKKKTKEESIPKIKEGRLYTDVEIKDSDLSLISAMKTETKVVSTEKNELEAQIDVQAMKVGIKEEIVATAIKNSDFSTIFDAVVPLAEGGNIMAMNLLGDMYSQSIPGVPKDYNLATKWYNLSAQKGDPIGQFKLGTMYCEGKGMEANLVECYKWFLVMEDKVSPNAKKFLKLTMSKVSNVLDEQEVNQAVALANHYKVDVLKEGPVVRNKEKIEISEKDLEDIAGAAKKGQNQKGEVIENNTDTVIKGIDPDKKPVKKQEGDFSLF